MISKISDDLESQGSNWIDPWLSSLDKDLAILVDFENYWDARELLRESELPNLEAL